MNYFGDVHRKAAIHYSPKGFQFIRVIGLQKEPWSAFRRGLIQLGILPPGYRTEAVGTVWVSGFGN
jgi:hypothetical protein